MPLQTRSRRLATAARWPAGVALTSWRYLWRTTPLYRGEQEGSWADDVPPPLPEGVSLSELQPASDGAGPLYHRRYEVLIRDSELSPEELVGRLAADPDQAAPSEFATFKKTLGAEGAMAVGDEYLVRMPGPWDGPVRVIELRPSLFRLATLQGHLEAGQIAFGAERRVGTPAGEDQGGEGDEALAGGHVGDEAGREGDREIRAAKAAEHAADQDRRIAQPGDGDAGGVDGGRVLADRPQAQAEAGLCHDEGGERHRRERQVDEERVAEKEIGNARRGVERGRAPALAVPGMTEHGRQSGGEHIEGDPGDDLVAALADAGEAVQEREGERGNDGSGKPDRRAAEGARRRRRREGRGQHLALKPDVDDAGALRPQPGQAGEEQRDRQPQGRIGERQDRERVH